MGAQILLQPKHGLLYLSVDALNVELKLFKPQLEKAKLIWMATNFAKSAFYTQI